MSMDLNQVSVYTDKITFEIDPNTSDFMISFNVDNHEVIDMSRDELEEMLTHYYFRKVKLPSTEGSVKCKKQV